MTILIAVKEPGEDWVYQERETAPTYQELADLVGWPGHAFCKCEYEFDLVSNSAPQHEGLESNITRGVHGSPLDVLRGTVIAVRRDEDGNTISLQESDKEGLKRIADSGSTNVWANEDGAPTSI